MKLTIKESVDMESTLYGYVLKSTTDGVDDIAVFGNNRNNVIKAGEKIISIFYDYREHKGTNYRTNGDADSLAKEIIDTAAKYDCEIAAEWPRQYNLCDVWWDGEDSMIIDRVADEYPFTTVRIHRGNFALWSWNND